MEYLGASEIKGNLLFLENVSGAAYGELVRVYAENDETRTGRVVLLYEDTAAILVYEGVNGMDTQNTRVLFTARPPRIKLSLEILGREFNGLARPRDGINDITAAATREINGAPINPALREYPRNHITTGISAIDGLCTLLKGQKLPIFSIDGLPHNKLAAQIAVQFCHSPNTAVVFAAMGIDHMTGEYFRRTFAESGQSERVAMYTNYADDPPCERIALPRYALTAAEYLAYDCALDVLVIITDITAYAEALREISSANNEIPARKGYPGYLYSDLASLYERAGIIKNKPGSVTQIPILTMPNGDISHPIPDTSGYITEGQIVLCQTLHNKNIYPPINPLPSLSRLMKNGIKEGFAPSLCAAYAQAQDLRALSQIIGEEELSAQDRKYVTFADNFENQFLNQQEDELRTPNQTIEIGNEILPK